MRHGGNAISWNLFTALSDVTALLKILNIKAGQGIIF
jgi:hypothetical protein